MKPGMTKHGHAWTDKTLIFLSWNGLAKPEINLLQGVGSCDWQCGNGGDALQEAQWQIKKDVQHIFGAHTSTG